MSLLESLLQLDHVIFKNLRIVNPLENYFFIFLNHVSLQSAFSMLLTNKHKLIEVLPQTCCQKIVQRFSFINLKYGKIYESSSWDASKSVDVKQVATIDQSYWVKVCKRFSLCNLRNISILACFQNTNFTAKTFLLNILIIFNQSIVFLNRRILLLCWWRRKQFVQSLKFLLHRTCVWIFSYFLIARYIHSVTELYSLCFYIVSVNLTPEYFDVDRPFCLFKIIL